MYVTAPDSERKPQDPSRSVGTTNYRHEVSLEEREKFDAALAAITRIKTTFDDWVIIGHAVVAARKYADRVSGRKVFHSLLFENGIMPPLDKATVSHLQNVMARLPEVLRWRKTVLTEHQRIAWASPRSIINRCPVFKIEKQQMRAATPRKATRLEIALEENISLKVEVERYRLTVGDDYGFNRQDRGADIVAVLTRGLSERKQHAVMVELVRQLGTKKQREVFGLEDDHQPTSSIPATDEVTT
jgi:hypothetical protein